MCVRIGTLTPNMPKTWMRVVGLPVSRCHRKISDFPRVVSWAAHARSYPSPMIRDMRGGLIFPMIRATYGRGGDNKLVSRSSRDSSEPDDSRHVWARRANVLQRDSLNRVSGYSL